MTNLEQQIKEYIKTSDDYILKKALVYEIFYEYYDLKHEIKLTLNDIKTIADDLMNSYYLNNELGRVIKIKIKKFKGGDK